MISWPELGCVSRLSTLPRRCALHPEPGSRQGGSLPVVACTVRTTRTHPVNMRCPSLCVSLHLSASLRLSLSLLHNYMLAGPGTRVAARLTTGLRPITASAATACSCLVCLAGCQKPSSQLPSSCNREDVSGRSRTTVVSGAWLWLIRFCVARCFSEPIRLSLTDTTMMIGKWHVRLRNVSSRSGPPLSCLLYTVG